MLSSALNKELSGIILTITRSMKNEVLSEVELGNLTLVQLHALMFLNHNPNAQVSDVSRFFKTTLPTSTVLIDKLVDGGYTTREKDERDRRVVRLSLTRRGKDLLGKALQQRQAKIERLLFKLTDDDKRQLIRIMRKLI